jgi:hypothetical protein
MRVDILNSRKENIVLSTVLYLFNASSMYTGESFLRLDEVHQWFFDQMGRWPNLREKRAMRTGDQFFIGSRSFSIRQGEMSQFAKAA